ncbi:hypothetical protein J2S71_000888 [Olsenella profusa DSM 13989]|uniref:hypothetical protein n=1 Tax=Olsenella profusa TaxID=138595 RepID=UPI0027896814|nr:hypothetical protein [Olsenella profusa]MDP9859192.1 hypothetical protein [Olsenella profusa DSM 13989]
MRALVPVLTVAVLGVLGLMAARPGRGAGSPDPDRLEYRMPRVWPATMAACGVIILGFAALCAYEMHRGNPTATWPVLAFFLGFAAFAFLACAQFLSWRVSVDGWGVRVRRLLFGARDVAWADVDAVSVGANRYAPPGVPGAVVLMSGGRRAATLDGMYLGGGRATAGQLLDAARRRGIPVAPPSELPAGLTPWGPLHRRYAALPKWGQNVAAVAITAVGLALFFGLLMLVYYLAMGHL